MSAGVNLFFEFRGASENIFYETHIAGFTSGVEVESLCLAEHFELSLRRFVSDLCKRFFEVEDSINHLPCKRAVGCDNLVDERFRSEKVLSLVCCDLGQERLIEFRFFRGKTHLSVDLFGDNLDFIFLESVVFSENGGLRLLPKRNLLDLAVHFDLHEKVVRLQEVNHSCVLFRTFFKVGVFVNHGLRPGVILEGVGAYVHSLIVDKRTVKGFVRLRDNEGGIETGDFIESIERLVEFTTRRLRLFG